MTSDQAIALYLTLTRDIHSYWAAFGALIVLTTGWMLSRTSPLRIGQRLALTIGWFAASGYLGSSLTNRYWLLSLLTKDAQEIHANGKLLAAIVELGAIYQHYETIVWSSFGAISIGAMYLVWSNVAVQSPAHTESR
jgi:hypothetical protein